VNSLKSPVIGVLLLALSTYAGIKVKLYFGVQDAMESLILVASPYATIKYTGITSSLTGSLGVQGVEIQTKDAVVPVRIGSAQLRGPGFGFIWGLARGKASGELPEWLELAFEDLDLPYVENLVPSPDAPVSIKDLLSTTTQPDACSLAGIFGEGGMYSRDRFPLRMGIRIGYRTGGQAGPAQLYGYYGLAGGESLYMEFNLSGMPSPQSAMLGKVPNLERYSFTFQPDAAQVSSVVNKCAERAGVAPANFVDKLMAGSDKDFAAAFGVVPGTGLRQALRTYLLSPAPVQVTGAPNLDLTRQPSLPNDPKLLVSLLQPRVTVGTETIHDLGFRAPRAEEPVLKPSSAADQTQAAPILRPKPRWLVTPVQELVLHLQKEVRIQSAKHPKPVEGLLVAIERGKASVEQRVAQGKLTTHVGLKDIEKLEVLRLPNEKEGAAP